MEKEALILALAAQLKEQEADIKAEAFIAHAMRHGFNKKDLLIQADSFFSRTYDRDMTGAELAGNNPYDSYLKLQLTRPGFYDMLPEGLFFQPGKTADRSENVLEMVAAYRSGKTKEKDIRTFFRPFENEFFQQQLQLEEEETKLLDGLNEGAMQEFFREFWGLPVALSPVVLTSFLLLIPYAHRIAGDLDLMQQSLHMLLGETTQIRRRRAPVGQVPEQLGKALGVGELGNDTVCGAEFMEDYPVLEYIIGPLQQTGVSSYTEGGINYVLIDTFNRFFAPVEADIIVTVEIDRSSAVMRFDEESEVVLGYSTVL